MWQVAPEIIGIACAQNLCLVSDSYFEPAAEEDAALLAFMRDRVLAGAGTWLIALLEQLDRLVVQIGANLKK